MITMGNDEFILYIRKRHHSCMKKTDELGRLIWTWFRENRSATATQLQKGQCLWGENGTNVNAHALPKTAMQFYFDQRVLPALYEFLDELGQR